jgi:hypothetical protein
MAIVPQRSNGKGSLKDLQVLINEHPDLLNALLRHKISDLHNNEIQWLSPLEGDNFAEYSDDDFINLLGLDLVNPLAGFWPRRGPQWDGLGKSKNGLVFMIEAKANIPEIVSSATAASATSKALIDQSLLETKAFLNINNNVDWSGKFYQYTNRLAHLYFLRERNNVPAYLVNIYFINDKEVKGPECKKEWLAALQVAKSYLGTSHHRLSKYTIDLFIDLEDFRK